MLYDLKSWLLFVQLANVQLILNFPVTYCIVLGFFFLYRFMIHKWCSCVLLRHAGMEAGNDLCTLSIHGILIKLEAFIVAVTLLSFWHWEVINLSRSWALASAWARKHHSRNPAFRLLPRPCCCCWWNLQLLFKLHNILLHWIVWQQKSKRWVILSFNKSKMGHSLIVY